MWKYLIWPPIMGGLAAGKRFKTSILLIKTVLLNVSRSYDIGKGDVVHE